MKGLEFVKEVSHRPSMLYELMYCMILILRNEFFEASEFVSSCDLTDE